MQTKQNQIKIEFKLKNDIKIKNKLFENIVDFILEEQIKSEKKRQTIKNIFILILAVFL